MFLANVRLRMTLAIYLPIRICTHTYIYTDAFIKRLPGWQISACLPQSARLLTTVVLCTTDSDCADLTGAICDTRTADKAKQQCVVPDGGACMNDKHCIASPLGPVCTAHGKCAFA
jgi:hypothetical protein